MTGVVHPQRLDFTLPDFTRISWVSDTARAVWEPRIARIRTAWSQIEWLSVAENVRPCALTRIHPLDLPEFGEMVAARGLAALPLGLEGETRCTYAATPVPFEPGKSFRYPVAVGSPETVFEFKRAWRSSDHDAIGKLLGFPLCCRHFFRRYWVDESSVDTTWPMAAATTKGKKWLSQHAIEIEGYFAASALFRWIGVRLVPHLPCTLDCSESNQLADKLAETGRKAGFEQEMDWAAEILGWSMEWDALHGIAEVRFPVAKVVTRTDATSERCQVRVNGPVRPKEAVSGLRFPYKNAKLLQLTGSPAFQRGLANISPPTHVLSDSQLYIDNGFSTFRAMQVAHLPIVHLARHLLAGRSGTVLDLGAGNGLLAATICEGTRLVPAGMEIDVDKVARARERYPSLASRFVAGNLFDVDRWPVSAPLICVILMIGRLFEVRPEVAQRLVNHVRACSENLILYFYSRPEYGDMPSMLEKLGLNASVENCSADSTVVAVRCRSFQE